MSCAKDSLLLAIAVAASLRLLTPSSWSIRDMDVFVGTRNGMLESLMSKELMQFMAKRTG